MSPRPWVSGADDARAELEVPEDVEVAAGIVVVEADEADEGRFTSLSVDDAFDEPLAVPSVDDLSLRREQVGATNRGRNRRGARVEARGFEDQRLKIEAGAGARVEAMTPADGAELVASELVEDGGEPAAHIGGEAAHEAALRSAAIVHVGAEEATEVEEAVLGDRGEDGFERRRDPLRGRVGGGRWRAHRGGRRGEVVLLAAGLLRRHPVVSVRHRRRRSPRGEHELISGAAHVRTTPSTAPALLSEFGSSTALGAIVRVVKFMDRHPRNGRGTLAH